eukprot:3240213-Pyramimonas_sp.AAC.1
MGGGDACGRWHWGVRWTYWGPNRVKGVPNWVAVTHANARTGAFGGAPYGATNPCEGCAVMCGGDACERTHC